MCGKKRFFSNDAYQSKIFFREWIVAARPPRAMAVVERKALGADLHAVLGVAADLDPALGRQGVEPLAGVHRADRIDVEEIDLGDGAGADEGTVDRLVQRARNCSWVSSGCLSNSIFKNCGQASRQQPQLMHLLYS